MIGSAANKVHGTRRKNPIKTNTTRVHWWLALSAGLALSLVQAATAAPSPLLPSVVQTGLTFYASAGPLAAVGAWQKGGPLEGDQRDEAQADRFRQIERSFGNYKSFELICTKEICASAKIVYVSMNFERGAAFTRFLVYRPAGKDWVVQHMDFNTRPEAIMPWLALEAER